MDPLRELVLDESGSHDLLDELFAPEPTQADAWANGAVTAGVFDEVVVLHASEILDLPRLERRFRDLGRGRQLFACTLHEGTGSAAFARWDEDRLVRAFSASVDAIYEDVGTRLLVEQPFWAGQHAMERDPGDPPFSLPFYPPELVQAAFRYVLGMAWYTDVEIGTLLDPDAVPLVERPRLVEPGG